MNKTTGRLVGNGIAALLALALLSYTVMLVRAKQEWGGASPDAQVLGTVADVSQRAMEQYCTGVIVTPRSTWLVGRREGSIADFEFARSAPDLAELVYGPRTDDPPPDSASSLGMLGWGMGLGSRPEVSFVSRLDGEGRFQLVAVVPDAACLQATPDGERVFLLTGLSRPDGTSEPGPQQNVIFQSDDQGKTWQWRKEGLFPAAEWIAWNLEARFHDARSVWAWRDDAEDPPPTAGQPVPSGLQYSPDGGTTVEDVMTSHPLHERLDAVQSLIGPQGRWGDANGTFGEVKRHVVQLGPEDAALWVSQTFRYALDDGPYLTHTYHLTRYARLTRKGGTWHLGEVKQLDGVAIDSVLDNRGDKVVAVLDRGDGAHVALLDRTSLEWQDQGRLPSAFGVLPSHSGLREWFVGRGVIVANVMSSHDVPRWLSPWRREAASISADAVFFSKDWGRSWQKLDMPGYLGVLGLDAQHERVAWAKGNWYDSTDLAVRTYGLK